MYTDEDCAVDFFYTTRIISLRGCKHFDWEFLNYLFSSFNIYAVSNGYQDSFQLMVEDIPSKLSKEIVYWWNCKMLNL